MKKVIIDTNILFSALLGKSKYLREAILSDKEISFYSCKFVFVELFKYKDKIQLKSTLSEDEILELLHSLLSKIKIFNEETVTDETLKKAYELCKDIDEKDTPFIAITIELSGQLWTKDKRLKEGLISKGFDSFFDVD